MKKIFEHIAKYKQLYLIIPAVLGIVCFLFIQIQIRLNDLGTAYGNTMYQYMEIVFKWHETNPLILCFISFAIVVCVLYASLPFFKNRVLSFIIVGIIVALLLFYTAFCPSFYYFPCSISPLFLITQVVILLIIFAIVFSDKICEIRNRKNKISDEQK